MHSAPSALFSLQTNYLEKVLFIFSWVGSTYLSSCVKEKKEDVYPIPLINQEINVLDCHMIPSICNMLFESIEHNLYKAKYEFVDQRTYCENFIQTTHILYEAIIMFPYHTHTARRFRKSIHNFLKKIYKIKQESASNFEKEISTLVSLFLLTEHLLLNWSPETTDKVQSIVHIVNSLAEKTSDTAKLIILLNEKLENTCLRMYKWATRLHVLSRPLMRDTQLEEMQITKQPNICHDCNKEVETIRMNQRLLREGIVGYTTENTLLQQSINSSKKLDLSFCAIEYWVTCYEQASARIKQAINMLEHCRLCNPTGGWTTIVDSKHHQNVLCVTPSSSGPSQIHSFGGLKNRIDGIFHPNVPFVTPASSASSQIYPSPSPTNHEPNQLLTAHSISLGTCTSKHDGSPKAKKRVHPYPPRSQKQPAHHSYCQVYQIIQQYFTISHTQPETGELLSAKEIARYLTHVGAHKALHPITIGKVLTFYKCPCSTRQRVKKYWTQYKSPCNAS